jgi:hypothetical protein
MHRTRRGMAIKTSFREREAKVNYLKWVLIGLFAAGALPMLSLAASNASLMPLAVLSTLSWGGFLYWFWRV